VELISGADGTRTRGLLAASQSLSQLSYGPWATKCSGEFVVLSPVDAEALIVLAVERRSWIAVLWENSAIGIK
jgi:hypothetical protein